MPLKAHIRKAIYSGPTPILRNWRALPIDKLTRAERAMKFIEHFCLVPEGALVGQPVHLADFQEAFFYAVYDNPAGTDTAYLSIARKNAKTATIAMIVLTHLVGPEAIQNSEIMSGARSRDQASQVFRYIEKMVLLSDALRSITHVVSSGKKVRGLSMNTLYHAGAAEAKTAHGGSPVVAILDEVGQVRGPVDDYISAVTTSQGAHKRPLLIAISTQAPTDADLFSIWIDDAKLHKPPSTVCHIYTTDVGADLLSEKGWRDSNPALGLFRMKADLKKRAEDASRMPTAENTFRNLYLNQRVESQSPFISRSAWEACAGEQVPIGSCDVVYGGLDLSAKTDLTALVLYGFHARTDTWNVYTYAWTPAEGLYDRSKRDRAPYDVWVRQGHLLTTPGPTVQYEWVAHKLAEIASDVTITSLGYDRWRMDLLKREMEKIGLSVPMVDVGMGYKDMAPAVENLEDKVLNAKIRHGAHPVLTMAAANTVVTRNPTGDRKPDKMKTSGRIDPFVALLIAEAVAGKENVDPGDFDAFISAPLVL